MGGDKTLRAVSGFAAHLPQACGETHLQVSEIHPEFGLRYSADSSLVLVGFSDADFGGCRLDRKSTSGTC